VDDADLTRSLADLMGHLRTSQYGSVVSRLEETLRGSGDTFIDTLARHLLYEEQVLFPELRRRDAGTAGKVQQLQKEHAHLRELATELAREIKAVRLGKAYDAARTFLAELYGHIDREAAVTDPIPDDTPPWEFGFDGCD
jgi:hemerythrin-like domain-containing protein